MSLDGTIFSFCISVIKKNALNQYDQKYSCISDTKKITVKTIS